MVTLSYFDMTTDVALATYLLSTPQRVYGVVSFGIIAFSLILQTITTAVYGKFGLVSKEVAAAVVGYLWQRGTTLSALVRRWYVLSPTGLCYYPSAQEMVRAPHAGHGLEWLSRYVRVAASAASFSRATEST